MRLTRSLRLQARARAQARRMNEMARVVKRELEDAHRGGGDFHDLSGVHEVRWQPDFIGFQRQE